MSDVVPVEQLAALATRSGIPRYRQIADQLAELIPGSPPGTRLPSEHDIAKHLGVSRATAIQALRELEIRGLIRRRQGRGSFVADGSRAVRSAGMGFLHSFSQDLRDAGWRTKEKVLSCEQTVAPDAACSGLAVPAGSTTWHISRLILSDGEPVVHATSWLPLSIYPAVDRSGIESSSLYEHLSTEYGPQGRPSAAEEEWRAYAADRGVAKLLDLEAGAPVMRVERRAFLADGLPAEYALSFVRADTFVVSVSVASDKRVNGSTTRVRVARR